MNKPDDYKLIEFWCLRLGSFRDFTLAQQKAAAYDGAPLDAIYRRDDGSWATIKDVDNPDVLSAALRLGLIEPIPDSGVRKATITVTVLYRPDEVDLNGMSLAEINHEITDGDAMGHFEIAYDEPLNAHQLKRAAERMGGDPSFFGGAES